MNSIYTNIGHIYLNENLNMQFPGSRPGIPNNLTLIGAEHPLRHILQSHCRKQNREIRQYRDWFSSVFGEETILSLGKATSKDWQIPLDAGKRFYQELMMKVEESILNDRFILYTACIETASRETMIVVTQEGLIVVLHFLEMNNQWIIWTAYFPHTFNSKQSNTLNRRQAMLSELQTMTYGLSSRRGLMRVPTATDVVRMKTNKGEELRRNIRFGNLEVWGEQGEYFDRSRIR